MKKTILLLAVLMGVSTLNFAGTETRENAKSSTLELANLEDMKFKISCDNVAEKARVSIKDDLGNVLYTEVVSKATDKYSKVFDLSNLVDGSYKFVVESGKDKVSKPFEISTKIKREVTAVN